jgi:hypothetical protein
LGLCITKNRTQDHICYPTTRVTNISLEFYRVYLTS